jgi:hypothetical protein
MNVAFRRLTVVAALVVSASGAAACGESITPPAGPSGPVVTTVLFSGTLAPGASSFYSILLEQTQVLSVTVASTTLGPTGPAQPTPASVGVGIPSGTECALMSPAVTVAPALQAQVAVQLNAGTYCVRIADAGLFPAPMDFAVRIVMGQPPSGTPAGGTETFASALAIQGSSSRTFTASQAGTVRLTLQSLGGPATSVGLGIGIPRLDGAGCVLTQSVTTGPGAGPHLTAAVAPGVYCVRVFDPGTLPGPSTFSVQIVFP